MKGGTVTIVGRPNVGKSSLFNRILKKRLAVVADREGVTRDLHFQFSEWDGVAFQLVDTGGFMLDTQDALDAMVVDKIKLAILESDVILFVADGLSSIVDMDKRLANFVRKSGIPFVLAVNKLESKQAQMDIHDFWKLGMGEPHPVSAKSGYGVTSLLDKIVSELPNNYEKKEETDGIRLAILGRPNSGKSTLVNKILGEDHLIVSPVAGTTRDSIDTEVSYKGHNIILTDTAGLRKKAKVRDDVEYFSNLRAIEAIRRSDVCVLLLDADRGLEVQDLKIFTLILETGKGMVICFNKWDIVEAEHDTLDKFNKAIINKVPDMEWIPKVPVSGLTGKRVTRMLDTVIQVYENLHKVLGREEVVKYFQAAIAKYPHPRCNKGSVNMRRLCQVTINPPGFVVEAQRPQNVFPSYERYLKRSLYNYFELAGAPVKFFFKRDIKLRTDEDLTDFNNYANKLKDKDGTRVKPAEKNTARSRRSKRNRD
ncbi:MAG: ribosome biogenesis GTPase Der [Fibrobacteria bacterium]|nr:ribosome biogenesis GTPase Der [Fibrobacteria bacterium]